MKKILLSTLVAAAAAMPAIAGVDNLNYQAVIKNGGEVVADKTVALKFELLDNSENVVYTEVQDQKTNAAGYVSCQLGKEDELASLEWGDLTLRVSIDLGSGYEVFSTEAVSSVPTALYALRSADTDEIKGQLENLNMTAAVVRVNEDNIAELQQNFENLGENLDKSFEQMTAQFEEVNGQLENLNMVAAVVRSNEAAVDTLQLNFRNLDENLNNAFGEMNAKFDEVNGQLENLNMVAAVVRVNEEAIETLSPVVEELVKDNEETKSKFLSVSADVAQIEGLAETVEKLETSVDTLLGLDNKDSLEMVGKLSNQVSDLTTEVEGLVKENDETQSKLNSFGADIARIEGLANDVESISEVLKEIMNPEEEGSLPAQIGELTGAVEGLVKDNEETQSRLQSFSAEIARIDGLAADFENLGENLDNAFNEMNTKFEDVEKQLENLNNVSAVVRVNEEAIEKLTSDVDAIATEVAGLVKESEDNKETINSYGAEIARIDGLAADFENLGENLDNSFNEMNAKFDNVEGQLENLNNVSAVVRANEEAIEGLDTKIANSSKDIQQLQDAVKALTAPDGEDSVNGKLMEVMGQIMPLIEALQSQVETLQEEVSALKGN